MKNKQFSERLNQELDDIGLPPQQQERVSALAKLLGVPRFKAEIILNGQVPVQSPLIETLANELEVEVDWLLGKSNEKHN